ncbi:MAG: transglycosylase SLT domain-containing protein [Rhodoglobus sp.]
MKPSLIRWCLLAGIMYVESCGRVDAVSHADALGLFQLKVAAAGDAAKRLRIPAPTRDELLSDLLLNARLAASQVAWLYRHGVPDLERVLVAYNADRGKLKQLISHAGSFEAWRAKRTADGRSEMLQYARGVQSFAKRFRVRGTFALGPLRAVDAVR